MEFNLLLNIIVRFDLCRRPHMVEKKALVFNYEEMKLKNSMDKGGQWVIIIKLVICF